MNPENEPIISIDNFNVTEFCKNAERDGVTHISTGVAVVKDGRLLLVRRVKGDYLGGNYELPGGGVDKGESLVQSALRELQEETGLITKEVIGTFTGFDYTTDKKPHVRQINFLVTVQNGAITLNPLEQDDYKWVTAQDLTDIPMSSNMHNSVINALNLIKHL